MTHHRDFIDVAGTGGNCQLVPADRRVANAIGPYVRLLAVDAQGLHVELKGQPGQFRQRQRLQAKVIEVVVCREELDVGEILGRLEDAGDLEAVLRGVVDCGGARPEKPCRWIERRGSKTLSGSEHIAAPVLMEDPTLNAPAVNPGMRKRGYNLGWQAGGTRSDRATATMRLTDH
jgi:hypothetical protein